MKKKFIVEIISKEQITHDKIRKGLFKIFSCKHTYIGIYDFIEIGNK
jgi:hypothetical protein